MYNQTKHIPLFNIPAIIKITITPIIVVHLIMQILPYDMQYIILYYFALIPAQYVYEQPFLWTLMTYALLHGGWVHLILNVAWFIIFAAPLVRLLSKYQFFILMTLANISGALAHILTHWASLNPAIGASAIVSGCMAAALYLIFGHKNSPIQPMVFFFIWIGLNLLSAIPGFSPFGGNIAWQAHIGGFIAGLLYAYYLKNKYSRI